MAEVHGSCDDRFSGVREALERNLEAEELGASVAVDLDGETVVDIWGGYRDQERTTPWTEDTIVNGWSTTKVTWSVRELFEKQREKRSIMLGRGEIGDREADAGVGEIKPGHSGVQARSPAADDEPGSGVLR